MAADIETVSGLEILRPLPVPADERGSAGIWGRVVSRIARFARSLVEPVPESVIPIVVGGSLLTAVGSCLGVVAAFSPDNTR